MIETIIGFFKKNSADREVNLPDGTKGLLVFETDGTDRIIVEEKKNIQNLFNLGSVQDFLSFVKDIPERYPDEANSYRELCVYVDNKDVPSRVDISTPFNARNRGFATFKLLPHIDFLTWFDGKSRNQTEFRRLLVEKQGQHDCDNLIPALTFLEYKTEVTFEASAETERNYVLGYKEKESKSGLNIPKTLTVTTPVVSGAEHTATVVFDIIIKKPTQEEPKISFRLIPATMSPLAITKQAHVEIVETEILIPALSILKENIDKVVSPLYFREEVMTSKAPTSDLKIFQK